MKTIKEALYDVIHRGKKPLKAIAEEIGVSENYLTRSSLPDQEDSDTGTGCRFPLKKLVPLVHATGDYSVLDVIEQSVGRFGVLLPPPGRMPTVGLARMTIKTVAEFSDLMREIECALDNDGKVDSGEAEKIRVEGYHAVQAILEIMAACEVKK